MPRLGMCSNNLNYLQNKTSRLYHIRRTYTKCKSKNVLEVIKSSKYISIYISKYIARKSEIYFEDFKTSRTFLI